MATFMEGYTQDYVRHLNEEYGDRFADVRRVYPDFSDDQCTRLGTLLENTNEAFARAHSRMLSEATQVSNVEQGLKNQYFDIITAVWPNLIAEQLFSVQPLRQKTGQIFYFKYVYGSNKGNIKRGDVIFSANEMAGYEGRNYTSEFVEDETIFTGDTSTTEFTGNLSYIPVRPGTVEISLEEGTVTDSGDGTLTGDKVSEGTIDYDTGAYSITFSAAPAEQDVYANYEYDLSYAPSTIPSLEIQVTETTVTARPRKLKGLYSLDAGYDLKMSQGIDMDQALLEGAAEVLKSEIDAELIMTAYRQAAQTITWNSTFNSQKIAYGKREFYEDFIDCIVRGSSMILKKTKRVEANWLVVGKRGADILTFIGAPRFVSSGDTVTVGPKYLGILDGKWRVFSDPFLDDNDFLLGYKGTQLIDAGLIYAPYLMFFATDTVMLEDFLGRRGFATTYGKKMVNADMYVRGRITESVDPEDLTTKEN